MKIRITSNVAGSQFGAFSTGNLLSTPKYPEVFLNHLVRQARCAEIIEDKMERPVIENKAIPTAPAKKKRGRPKKHS